MVSDGGNMEAFKSVFAALPDPREQNSWHELHEIPERSPGLPRSDRNSQ